jgi:hypothetical protein
VVFNGVSQPTVSWSPATGTATASLVLTGLDTGVYPLTLVNGGAQPSNAVSFTVTPGLPHLTTVAPASAPRQNAPVLVTLTGTNFAKPDANGNAASQVMFIPVEPAWAASTAYALGAVVSKGDNLYKCIAAGTSGSAGPSGTGAAIADGTVTWAWAATWETLPAGNTVTVQSATTIVVTFDTRTAVPGTYQIAVWNPPLVGNTAAGLQKSNALTFTVN